MLNTYRVVLATLLLNLGACGLKGPLYDPRERDAPAADAPSAAAAEQPAKKSATQPPGPQLQKEERERAEAASQAQPNE